MKKVIIAYVIIVIICISILILFYKKYNTEKYTQNTCYKDQQTCQQNCTLASCSKDYPKGKCNDGYTCVIGSCQQNCGNNSPCGVGYTCVNGSCQQNCGNNPPCGVGYTCVNGECLSESTYVCSASGCVNQPCSNPQ